MKVQGDAAVYFNRVTNDYTTASNVNVFVFTQNHPLSFFIFFLFSGLVLSGLRQRVTENGASSRLSVPLSLWKAAIWKTARQIPHLTRLDQGAGVFQVGEAFSYIDSIISFPESPL